MPKSCQEIARLEPVARRTSASGNKAMALQVIWHNNRWSRSREVRAATGLKSCSAFEPPSSSKARAGGKPSRSISTSASSWGASASKSCHVSCATSGAPGLEAQWPEGPASGSPRRAGGMRILRRLRLNSRTAKRNTLVPVPREAGCLPRPRALRTEAQPHKRHKDSHSLRCSALAAGHRAHSTQNRDTPQRLQTRCREAGSKQRPHRRRRAPSCNTAAKGAQRRTTVPAARPRVAL